jgi:hypothetical protein
MAVKPQYRQATGRALTAYILHETSWQEKDGAPPHGSCGFVGGARACANRFPDASRERRRVRGGSCVRREPTITSTAPTPAHYRFRACAEGRRRLGRHGWPRLIMGTTATKLAGADGKTICICGRTASGGIVAAKAITPVTGTRDGIIYPNTGRPTTRNGLDRYPRGPIASPAEACATAGSVVGRNCAKHSDAATMTDCYFR